MLQSLCYFYDIMIVGSNVIYIFFLLFPIYQCFPYNTSSVWELNTGIREGINDKHNSNNNSTKSTACVCTLLQPVQMWTSASRNTQFGGARTWLLKSSDMTGSGNLPDFASKNGKHFCGTTRHVTERRSFPLSLLQIHAFTSSRSCLPCITRTNEDMAFFLVVVLSPQWIR